MWGEGSWYLACSLAKPIWASMLLDSPGKSVELSGSMTKSAS